MPQRLDIPLGPLNVSVPARRAAAGTLAAAVNLVPQGPPDAISYEAAAGAMQRSDVRRLVALGAQIRDKRGELSDLVGDPNQSLERLIGVTDEEICIIDPAQTYAKKSLYDLPLNSGRQAQFAPVSEAVWTAISESGKPGEVLEVRDDAVLGLSPPPLPRIAFSHADDADGVDAGEYVARYAWAFEDGSYGPPTGPHWLVVTGTATRALTFAVESYPSPLDPAWQTRIAGIAVYLQPPQIIGGDNNPLPGAEAGHFRNPAHHIATIDDVSVGGQITFKDASVKLLTYPNLVDESLLQHQIKAGACFSYNSRLLLGDVAYDYYTPIAGQYLTYLGGANAAGNDYWVRVMIELHVKGGLVRRWSEPLPFDTAHMQSFAFPGENGSMILHYNDLRAKRWYFYVAPGDPSDADAYVPGDPEKTGKWLPVRPAGLSNTLEPGGGNYAFYHDGATYDLRPTAANLGNLDNDIVGNTSAHAEAARNPDYTYSTGDQLEEPTLDLSASGGALTADERLRFEVFSHAFASGYKSSAYARVIIRVYDSSNTLLKTEEREARVLNLTQGSGEVVSPGSREGGFFTVYMNNVTGADHIEFELAAGAGAGVTDDYNSAEGTARIDDAWREPTEGGASVTGEDIAADNAVTGHDPNRMLVSSINAPRELLASRAQYVGDGPADRIMGFASNTLPASEGQFGEYPVYCLGRESVHLGQVGPADGPDGPIAFAGWRKVSSRGCVSRYGFANIERAVVFASDDGIYQLAPELSGEPISRALHEHTDVLETLQDGSAAMGYFRSIEGRRELWISCGKLTFAFSLTHGIWSILDTYRTAYARFGAQLFSAGALTPTTGGALYEEGASTSAQKIYIQTRRMYLSDPGLWKRMRTFWLRQDVPLGALRWRLIMHDPNGSAILLQEALTSTAPYDVFDIPQGMLLEAEVQLVGEGQAGQSIEEFGFEYDVLMPHRRPATMATDGAVPWSCATGVTAPAYLQEINQPPQFTSTPPEFISSGSVYTYNITCTDPEAQPLTIIAFGSPPWLTLTDHGNGTATLTGTAPVVQEPTQFLVELAVDDGDIANTVAQIYEITVAPNSGRLDFSDPANSGLLAAIS